MAELLAQSPFGGKLPLNAGACELVALAPAAITSITLKPGQAKQVSSALKKSHGLSFPAANRVTGGSTARCVWVAPGQALLIGKPVKNLTGAALSDQTDGWAVMRLQGRDSGAVLARLVPIDLRSSVFKPDFAAKTLLFHMPLSISRWRAESFDLMVFRSMAATAVQELENAMESVAAQANL